MKTTINRALNFIHRSNWLRAAVFANDGILSTASVAIGVATASAVANSAHFRLVVNHNKSIAARSSFTRDGWLCWRNTYDDWVDIVPEECNPETFQLH